VCNTGKNLKTKESFTILPISSTGAKVFGEIKKAYKDHRQITSKETMKKLNIDIILASTAIVESCILVSPDNIYSVLAKLRKGFKYENWLT